MVGRSFGLRFGYYSGPGTPTTVTFKWHDDALAWHAKSRTEKVSLGVVSKKNLGAKHCKVYLLTASLQLVSFSAWDSIVSEKQRLGYCTSYSPRKSGLALPRRGAISFATENTCIRWCNFILSAQVLIWSHWQRHGDLVFVFLFV